jgi:hypothetical protein
MFRRSILALGVLAGAFSQGPPAAAQAQSTPDPLTGETPIKSEFALSTMLQPSWGEGKIAPSAAPDVVGAFRFQCNPGQLLYDDPIVYPNQPGKSHLHQFYGNLDADAASTYRSLRTKGNSSCGGAVNRSGYWQPAMLDGKGSVVLPVFTSIYYKRRPRTDPVCHDRKHWAYQGICVPLPNGLKFIFGYDMLTKSAPTGSFDWICVKDGQPVGSAFPTLKKLADAGHCQAGMEIWSRGHSPTCWNGKDLDSPNHRTHVAYAQRDMNSGQLRCGGKHPYVIADFQLSSAYKIMPGDDIRLWSLSSDAMVGKDAGASFHADFFMAWDPEAHAMWEGPDGCIERMLNCSGGDMGNGLQIIDAWARGDEGPRLVPLSSIPGHQMAAHGSGH